MKYDAIVFDFDGVLIDSIEIKGRAFRTLYLPHGEKIADEAYREHFTQTGVSRFEKIKVWHKRYLGIDLGKTELDDLAEQYSDLVEDAVASAPLANGAIEFLKKYSGRLPLYISSATPEGELNRIVDRLGIRKYFEGVYGHPSKKSDVLNLVVATKKLEKNKVLMIGDAEGDAVAAKSSGVEFLGMGINGLTSFTGSKPRIIENFTALEKEIS